MMDFYLYYFENYLFIILYYIIKYIIIFNF